MRVEWQDNIMAPGYKLPVIVGREQDVEIIQPDKLTVALECLYCRRAYVADALEKVTCPTCGAYPEYEQLLKAIEPMAYKPLIEGSFPDPNRYAETIDYSTALMGTASSPDPRRLRYGVTSYGPAYCKVCKRDSRPPHGLCEMHGGGSSYKGEPVDWKNRDRIKKESGKEMIFIDGRIV